MPNQPFTTTVSFSPRASRSVGRARHAFRVDADAWGIPEDATDTAELLLSELLTNACRHAKYPPGRDISATWTLTPTAGLLRIEVSDANRRLPKPRQAAADDEAGRGLELLAALPAPGARTSAPTASAKRSGLSSSCRPATLFERI